jgi:4-aminobutyrate aminotransferase/(S)-3-amino-2-methylpropionate transaminase
VLEVFEEEGLVQKAADLGEKLKKRFEQWQQQFAIIGEIRGLGAMLGLELVKGDSREPAAEEAKKLVNFCYEKKLVILACGSYSNIIRILAPFVITDEQLEQGLAVMEEGLLALSKANE